MRVCLKSKQTIASGRRPALTTSCRPGKEPELESEALLFLKKKKQKNFYLLGAAAHAVPTPAVNESFFASFFSKKEALSSFQLPLSA